MRIASWNINSLRKRQDRLFAWLEATKPDIVCLQETKCPDELFPTLALQAVGYRSAYHGAKSYNGVAILAKSVLHDVRPSLCDEVIDPLAGLIAANAWRFENYATLAYRTRFESITTKPNFIAGGIIRCARLKKIAAYASTQFWRARQWRRSAAHPESISRCARARNHPITRQCGRSSRSVRSDWLEVRSGGNATHFSLLTSHLSPLTFY